MKQLLLRVPDQVHQRLASRAAEQGRSVNALATEILDTATGGDLPDRRARLRARAAALGMMQATSAPVVSPAQRRRTLASLAGIGPMADRLIDEERNRV